MISYDSWVSATRISSSSGLRLFASFLAGISTDTKMSWLMGSLSPFMIFSRSEANASNPVELPIPPHKFCDAGFQRHLRAEAHPLGQCRDIGPGLDHITGLHRQVVATGL